jgi:hypothetical protein
VFNIEEEDIDTDDDDDDDDDDDGNNDDDGGLIRPHFSLLNTLYSLSKVDL